MDISKAVIKKLVSDEWGFCIFEEDSHGNERDIPILYLLQKCNDTEYQMCGGWNCDTLLKDHTRGKAGIAIDAGQNWVCPGSIYSKIWNLMSCYLTLWDQINFPDDVNVF